MSDNAEVGVESVLLIQVNLARLPQGGRQAVVIAALRRLLDDIETGGCYSRLIEVDGLPVGHSHVAPMLRET